MRTHDEFVRAVRAILQTTLVAAALACAAPAAASAAIIDVSGYTLGCFGSGCSTFGSPVTSSSDFGLTFTGTSFDVDTDASGAATNIPIGTISRTNEQIKNSESVDFTLQVIFTLPSGITGGSPGAFTATIKGTTPGGGGAASIVFDEPWLEVTFSNGVGQGSFEFNVINDPSVNPNGTATILGGIRNATFTPTQEEEPPPTGAPEPSMFILAGAAATALVARRRKAVLH